jgi:SMC interacting uncharacterized protein involved in chromosome segregation
MSQKSRITEVAVDVMELKKRLESKENVVCILLNRIDKLERKLEEVCEGHEFYSKLLTDKWKSLQDNTEKLEKIVQKLECYIEEDIEDLKSDFRCINGSVRRISDRELALDKAVNDLEERVKDQECTIDMQAEINKYNARQISELVHMDCNGAITIETTVDSDTVDETRDTVQLILDHLNLEVDDKARLVPKVKK